MSHLNCRLGDLAVSVTAALPENIGKIVHIVKWHGIDSWFGFPEPTPLWEVELSGSQHLVYELGDGTREYVQRGLVPDAFLRRVPPLEGDPAHTEEDLYEIA